MGYRTRRLPHWDPEDAAIFLTWRLHGSLPAPAPEWECLPVGKRFAAEDQALLRSTGPHYLANPEVADCVANAIVYGAEGLLLYELHAWVIMSNHVHLLIDPKVSLPRLTQSVKTFSAREANAILGRTGRPFWANESYDHWVRTLKEFENIIRYIEWNPVKAGLVAGPERWRWSSAAGELRSPWAGQEARPTGRGEVEDPK